MTVITLPIILAWAALLVVQNASFTIVSRARNSGSDWYHAIASVFSNGIWFVSQTFIVLGLVDIARSLDWRAWTGLATIYVVCTVFGSVVAGKAARRWLETGNRRVGAYNSGEGGSK